MRHPSRKPRYALTIDPGFAYVGVAVVWLGPQGMMHKVVHVDVWETTKSDKKRGVRAADDDFRRTCEIASNLQALIANFEPVVVTAEAKSPVRNASAAAKIASMIGVLAGEVERRGLPYVQASPQEVRMTLGLSKGATKEEIQEKVRTRLHGNFEELFGLIVARSSTAKIAEARSTHAWDAIAAFIACQHTDIVRAVARA